MTLHDLSHARRIATLFDRVADLERQIEALSQVTAAPAAPRDIWLGRTTANGQTYPTSGNTFFVELIRGDFDLAAGDQAVTEYPRSTIVCARTWPAAYVPEDQQVVVMRMRGKQGPGEWWIETHSVDLATAWGLLRGGYAYDHQGVINTPTTASWSQELTGLVSGPSADDTASPRLRLTSPGVYSIEAWTHVRLRMHPASVGGYGLQYQNLALTLLKDGGSEVGRGEAQISSNAHDGRVTVRLSCVVSVDADTPALELWIAGTDGGWAFGNLTVWRWEMLATRLGDSF